MHKSISLKEWQSFITAIDGSSTKIRDRAIFSMMYIHGLRVSELTGLKTRDIDFVNQRIFIRRLKNGRSATHLLHISTAQHLRCWLQVRKNYVSPVCEDEWLFLSTKGKRISRQWIYMLSKKYSEKAGLKKILQPHVLRHSCGYALAEQGVNVKTIQEYLGHRNRQHSFRYIIP
ncbi:tyrosine-type recombinase/integrase [Escherichia coli]|uniref:tyrosine-type recombinase/integrase n=1 Tax=Escherichia coli TaxID=562 RepID=UPI0038B2C40B